MNFELEMHYISELKKLLLNVQFYLSVHLIITCLTYATNDERLVKILVGGHLFIARECFFGLLFRFGMEVYFYFWLRLGNDPTNLFLHFVHVY